MKDLLLGMRTTFRAFNFVFKNKMGHYFLYPIIITLILLYGAKKLIETVVEIVNIKVSGWIGLDQADLAIIPEGFFSKIWFYIKQFWNVFSESGVTVIMWIIMLFLTHKVIKYVTLILMSPVMAYLSEKTEQVLTKKEYPFNWKLFLEDVWRGVLLAIRNFFVEMGLIILIWIVGMIIGSIPGLNILMIVIAPAFVVLTWLIGAYFYGFSTIDYVNERRRLNVKQSVKFIRRNKWLAIGNGTLFVIFISIPVLGAYLGPVFATIMCTSGAVLALHEKIGLDKDKEEDYILMSEKEKGKSV